MASLACAQTWDLSALRSFSGLTPSQWEAVRRGRVQAKILTTQEHDEVAVVGAARARANTACFRTKFQNIESFKKNPAVLKIHKFEPPVEPRDLAGFSLPESDFADLPHCRIGNCIVKLPADAITQMSRVNWSQPGHDMRAQAVFRDEMANYLKTYLQQGNSALVVYRDMSKPVSLAQEFAGVLDARPGLGGLVPQFQNYLAEYPKGSLAGVSSFLYWSTESFGVKPVDSITQVFMYPQPGRAVIASKQLYASHYFEGSLGLTAAMDDRSDPSHPGMYLVYLNRSRIDLLNGFLGGLRRAIVRGRLESGMRKNLAEVVRKLETSCAEYPNPGFPSFPSVLE